MRAIIIKLLQNIGGIGLLAFLLMMISCQGGQDVYLYEVNELEVSGTNLEKSNLKTDLEFLSLAYSDLFGTTISENALNQLVNSYNAVGDKQLIADYIILNMLEAPGASIPSDQEMRADVDAFIKDTYKKFFVREPSEYERWYLQQLIEQDTEISPEQMYYAFLTSDEYRYY
ncbi:MAG: hypothetical protein AAF927_25610 [Bacteroidota bacterium]